MDPGIWQRIHRRCVYGNGRFLYYMHWYIGPFTAVIADIADQRVVCALRFHHRNTLPVICFDSPQVISRPVACGIIYQENPGLVTAVVVGPKKTSVCHRYNETGSLVNLRLIDVALCLPLSEQRIAT